MLKEKQTHEVMPRVMAVALKEVTIPR